MRAVDPGASIVCSKIGSSDMLSFSSSELAQNLSAGKINPVLVTWWVLLDRQVSLGEGTVRAIIRDLEYTG